MMNATAHTANSAGKTINVVGFGWRLVAALIDGLLVGFLSFLFAFIIGFIIWFAQIYGEGKFYPTERLFTVFGFILSIAYYVGFWVRSGQTPGKTALGLKVVSTDGSPVSWGKAFLRYIGYIINIIIFLLGFLWIAFDQKRQGWHDKMAGTYVIFAGTTFSDADVVTIVPADRDRKWLWLILWIISALLMPLSLYGSIWILGPALTELLTGMLR
jgi:uncharacterized RDD family membrane protein YckC